MGLPVMAGPFLLARHKMPRGVAVPSYSVISGQWSAISGQCPQSPPWEGEAPAEPQSILTAQSSLFAVPP